MQVRITAAALVDKIRRRAFGNKTSIPREVTNILIAFFAIERKMKQWRREKVKRK